MNLKKILFLILFIAFGIFLSRKFLPSQVAQKNEGELVTAPAIASTPVISSDPIHAQVTIIQPKAGSAPAPENHYQHPPQGQIVDFKVVNGLAVAYGDTIIGKLPAGISVNSGLTEIKPTRLWVGNKIPYLIDETIQNKSAVKEAIDLFEAKTNIRFVPLEGQEDAIAFTLGTENCMSSLGRGGGLQPIYLEPRCGKIEIAHEIMHALGFVHEQSRTDRDQYVTVFWQNIQPQFQAQFAMVPESLMTVYGDTPFDPTSILMYDPHIFSISPKLETLQLKKGGTITPSESGLSDIDVMRVNRLYQL